MQSAAQSPKYNIQLYKHAWISIKVLEIRGIPTTTIVWTRKREEATEFSSAEFAEEFIREYKLRHSRVKVK